MCGFSIILILKRIMTFKVKESVHFAEKKNTNFNKNEAKSKRENSTHFYRDEPCTSANI